MNIRLKTTVRAIALLLAALNAQGAATDLATAPLVTSSTSSVMPNLMFILDDSGSMDWSYLPDWADDTDPFSWTRYTSIPRLNRNSGFNGVAYNPAITYSPPVVYGADGSLDTTTYPSQTSANTAAWTTVRNDGYGVQSATTSDITASAYYYTFLPGEHCDGPSLRTCTTASSPSADHPYAATLRWCSSTALTTCQAVWISGSYTHPRYPQQATATLTISGTASTSVTSIKVDNKEILSAATAAVTSSTAMARNIVAGINACLPAATGACEIAGYSASSSGGTVTINAPATAGNITHLPAVLKSGTMTVTPAAFSGYSVPGLNFRRDIVAANDSYPYPGSTAKASTRSDCAGSTCTYAEEMTNFANWWAYYRTRMQMMKTSTSHAFSSVGANYRVGYMSLNNNTAADFLNIGQFDIGQKRNWYAKLFAANPSNSTPLRRALARAGRLYAGKLNGTTFNGSVVTEPMQYSCQQNFTILSTDGYWNGDAGYRVDGSTAVGNQDGGEPRPFNDGATVTYNRSTSQLQYSQTQAMASTSQLQQRTTQIQRRTTQIQEQTIQTQQVSGQLWHAESSDRGRDGSWSWSAASNCTQDEAGDNRDQCVVGVLQARTSSNRGNTWSAWANVSSCTEDDSSDSRRECRVSQTWSTVASCTPTRTGSSGTYAYTGGAAATDCLTVTSAWANVSTCVASATVACRTTDTGWGNVSSCSASGPTNGQTVSCQTTDTGWVGVGSCSPSSASGRTVTCQTITGGPTPVASCTAQVAGSGNAWLQRTCTTNVIAPAAGVASCTADAPTAANNYVSTNCTTVTTGPTATATCTAESAAAANNHTTTTCSVGTTSGGTSNTLADVAEYYYATDLRTAALDNCTGAVVAPAVTGNDVCSNDVPTSGQDGASTQHMTTFTLGLGANGYMQFSPSYATAASGDYFDVRNGTAANPGGGVCSWQSSGTTCNWPVPSSDSQANIDDLWHAAVNGRGTYFSATSPSTLAAGLGSALAGVSSRLGASAAATTSNPNVTSGDNFVFSSTFTTQDWAGQLFRQQIDLTTGAVPVFDINVASSYDWAAQSQLDSNAARAIHTFDSAAGAAANKLKAFEWASLTAAEQAYFNAPNISTLSQFCAAGVTCLSAADQTAAAGANLVAFLRGERTNEGASTDTSKYYRQRSHILGDIVNAEAVYVKASLYEYADAGYSDFKAANATRQGMVYAAANDGMLHAFNAGTGAETWAYVPSMVLPGLYKLADKNYSAQHQYYVDGTPVVGEICPRAPAAPCTGSEWKTILVGGLNRGGRGYYALDITDPAAPKALWEFTDTNMGYTYGNPEIAKLADGTWVVLVASGYNNITPGDGVGRLYVINASTGALIRAVSTATGSVATPSGLARIRAWADNAMADNTALRVYGGDLLGNLWRFDINNNVGASGYEAERLTTLVSSSGTMQPITTKPELGEVGGNAVVFVGTGRFLGTTDLSDTSQQSFYAVKDRLGNAALTPFPNPRGAGAGFIRQVQTVTSCPAGSPTTICTAGQAVRTSTANAVNFATDNGWYLDLPDSGERANTDPTLALGTLGFTTNVPNVSACTAGGYSFRYFLDYRTGAAVSTSTTAVVGVKLGNALATRGVFVRLPNNTVVQLTRMSDGTTMTTNVPIGSGSGATRRVSWRELIE